MSKSITFWIAVFFLCVASRGWAQPISPQDGGPFPPAIQDALENNPDLFTFDRAFIKETERLRHNRELVEQGQLGAGLSQEELRALTVVSGTKSVPVLLGKYSNTGANPIVANSLQQELFTGPWPPYGTMHDYYWQVSYHNLNLQGTVYNFVTLPNPDTFYEGGAGCYGICASGKAGQYVRDVLQLQDSAVDFRQYDNDGPDGVANSGDDDGFVDFVAILQPEIGAECGGNAIWSHRSRLTNWTPFSAYTTGDIGFSGQAIKVNDYVIMPALSCGGTMIEIGVFCHEFGHAFGLPDLYDTYASTPFGSCLNDRGEGVGEWCLMGSGNWNQPACPAHMCAWSKAQLGWINPALVTQNLGNWPVPSSTTTATAFKLWCGTPSVEYFLAEYRTATGFDSFLHAPGLLVWHVDESAATTNNRDNANECHKRVDLECADAAALPDHTLNTDDLDKGSSAGGNRGDAGDPFCNPKVFNATSNPSSVAYNGTATNVGITDIQFCGQANMRADFNVCNPTGTVDLCIRDCPNDVCVEPSPCPVFWESPDIWIDNNMDGVQDAPVTGIANNLFTRVRNAGSATTSTPVSVDFYYTNPALSLTFPSGLGITYIGTTVVPVLGAGMSVPVMISWVVPVTPPNIDHYCIGVVAHSTQDDVLPATAVYAPVRNNIAGVNIYALVARAGTAVPPIPGQLPGDSYSVDSGPRRPDAVFPDKAAYIGDHLADTREGGESWANALVIPNLPYTDSGATCDNLNDITLPCASSAARDVVYRYTAAANQTINVSLCGSGYDTALGIYDQAQNNIACNDDFCGLQSEIDGIPVTAGSTYYIVVDGYSDNCGSYIIHVTGTGTVFAATRYVDLCNTGNVPTTAQVRIGHPPEYNDAIIPPNWTVNLTQTQAFLYPGDCVTIGLQVTETNPVHLDRALIPMTEILNGQVVGGATQEFRIDNVEPRPPCGFTVWNDLRPQGDANPGQAAIRVSWAKENLDILGFPEEIREWSIYRGTTAGFVPGPSNLLVRTCRDEDPTTPSWDHFADLPSNPAAVWYKMFAVDRAGTPSDTCLAQLQQPLGAPGTPGEGLAEDDVRLSVLSSNPGANAVRLGFNLPADGHVLLQVFDVSGRAVATLLDEASTAGYHNAQWDKKTREGSEVGAGLYFARLEMNGKRVTQRIVLIR